MATAESEVKLKVTGESKSAEKAIERTQSKLLAFNRLANNAVKSVGKGLTKPFKDMRTTAERSFGKLMNIVKYRLIRGTISKLIQSLDQGKKNIDAYDEALSRTSWSKAASLMEGMNANATVLKNTFASLYMTILAQIKPAIDIVTDAVVGLVNAINQLMSALMGRGGYTKALKYPQDYAEAASGAAKATRLWLGAFDEINRLDDNSGGGGGSSLDYNKMFEESAISSNLQSLADSIKESISKGDWYGVGKTIADKLNEQIESFNFHDAGARLGIKIRNGVSVALGFLENFNFSNVGQKFAEHLNGIIEFVNWSNLGAALIRGLTAVVDLAAGFFGNLNWGAIAKGLSDFLAGAINAASSWIKSKNWGEVTNNLFSTIKSFVLGIDFGTIFGEMWKLAASLVQVGLGALFLTLGKVFVGIGNLFQDEAGRSWPGRLFMGIGLGLQYWGDKITGGGEDTAKKYEEGLDNGLFQAFKTVADWIEKIDKLFSDFTDRFNDWKENFNLKLEAGGWTKPLLGTLGGNTVKGYNGRQKVAVGVGESSAINKSFKETLVNAWNNAVGEKFQIRTKALGGTVPSGDLFIANEAGPELVGTVGHRTTVTNQQQFTQGLENANYNVVTAIYRMADMVVNAINAKDTTVEIDGMKFARTMNRNLQQVNAYAGTSLVRGV